MNTITNDVYEKLTGPAPVVLSSEQQMVLNMSGATPSGRRGNDNVFLVHPFELLQIKNKLQLDGDYNTISDGSNTNAQYCTMYPNDDQISFNVVTKRTTESENWKPSANDPDILFCKFYCVKVIPRPNFDTVTREHGLNLFAHNRATGKSDQWQKVFEAFAIKSAFELPEDKLITGKLDQYGLHLSVSTEKDFTPHESWEKRNRKWCLDIQIDDSTFIDNDDSKLSDDEILLGLIDTFTYSVCPQIGMCFDDKPIHEMAGVLLREFNRVRPNKILGADKVKQTIKTAVAKYESDAPEKELHCRVGRGGYRDNIFIENGFVIRGGQYRPYEFEIPIAFLRKALTYPTPLPGGTFDDWDKVLPNVNENGKILIVLWALSTLIPTPGMEYPILELTGPQGSGKSLLIEFLTQMLDPSLSFAAPSKIEAGDIFLTAVQKRIITYDNVTSISQASSDELASLATGSGMRKRKLYSDSELIELCACRPILIGSIPGVISRPDLLDRSLIVQVAPLKERMSSQQLERLRESDIIGKLFGYLLAALAQGMHGVFQSQGDVFECKTRMGSFFQVCMHASEALGISQEKIREAIETNHSENLMSIQEQNRIAQWLIENDGYTGTKTQFAATVGISLSEVRQELPTLQELLVSQGFSVNLNARDKNRTRIIKIEKEKN